MLQAPKLLGSSGRVFDHALSFRNALLFKTTQIAFTNTMNLSFKPLSVTIIHENAIFANLLSNVLFTNYEIKGLIVASVFDFDILKEEESYIVCDDEEDARSCDLYILGMKDKSSEKAGVYAANRIYEKDKTCMLVFATTLDNMDESKKEVSFPFVSTFSESDIVTSLSSILRFTYR